MNPTTDPCSTEQLVTTLSHQLASLTRSLCDWIQQPEHTLAQAEQHVLRLLKTLGSSLLAGLCSLAAPAPPDATIACSCGQTASYQRLRSAQVITLLGLISIARPYYLCSACGHGQHPLDAQLQFAAGSRSAALDELLALLGATQDSFAQAAQVLERLSAVHLAPNTVRDATEQLGTVLLAHQALPLEQRTPSQPCSSSAASKPARLYITMDGVMTHLRERGWSELKVGCCYQTSSHADRKRPGHVELRAHTPSYLSTLEGAESFGWQLWQEAVRRGVLQAEEVVVLGDGAHWIWSIAERHFPGATQIVDWYHASGYIWSAASALWGEAGTERESWARSQLKLLWEGQVDEVVNELEQRHGQGEAVEAARSYYHEHKRRMDYASYRARGMQIGSGSAESACKQLVTARLKGAGMIWQAAGAEAVAAVRAWLKSERWEEALRLRGAPRRSYQRKAADCAGAESAKTGQAALKPAAEETGAQDSKPGTKLSGEVLARVQAELAEQHGKNAWGKAWSAKRHQQLAAQAEQQKHTRTA